MRRDARIAVTGASGALGRVALDLLLRTFPNTFAVGRTPIGAGFVSADLTNAQQLAAALQGVDAIVHCAGKVAETDDFSQNLSMASALASASPSKAPVLNLSSVSVYGASSAGIITEATPCHPVTEYGKSKLACERAFDSLGARVCHLRIANVFPDTASPPGRVARILKGAEMSSLVYARDVAAACILLLEAGTLPHAVNVCRDPQTLRQVWGSPGFSLPPTIPHWIRMARGRKSLPASTVFSNGALLALGWTPS
jgi:nucleoside-diphosphate-sugar epimerase